jgi:hypothetical protein
MANYMVMAAMKGEFLARSGNVYENFQMLGYVEASSPFDAVKNFFEVPQFPIDWGDITYMWAESLEKDENNGHYGELDRIYLESLLFDTPSTGEAR